MSYFDHIRACNAHDLAGFRPLRVGTARVGWVRHALAARLAGFSDVFTVSAEAVVLAPALADFEARTAAVAAVVDRLVAEDVIPKTRGETYPVLPRWGAVPLFGIDRSAVAYFGVAAYGLHVNGYVRCPDGSLELWVGRRARDRGVAPGKFDNLIAGGQPLGLTLAENLVKEAHEEAGIDAETAGRAVPVGAVTYCMEVPEGLKPDTLFLYDLELPPDFVPRNTDGEVEAFWRWPLERVAEVVRETDDYKFNCNLVVIDFLIRHGFLKPDDPGYPELVTGLHRGVVEE